METEGLNAMQAWAAKSRAQRSRKGEKEKERTSGTAKKTRPAPRKRAATKARTVRAPYFRAFAPKLGCINSAFAWCSKSHRPALHQLPTLLGA